VVGLSVAAAAVILGARRIRLPGGFAR
jgi:hypothetical protein